MSLLTADPPAPPAGDPAPPVPPADPPAPAPEWVGGLPDDLRTEKGWERFKDVGSLARSYRELEKKIGQTGTVRVPGPDAKPDEIAAWHEKLGVPKDVAGYEIDLREFPGLQLNEADLAMWKGKFHALGISKEQARGLVAVQAEYQQNLLARTRQQWIAEHDTLRQEWGEPLFNRRVTLASRALSNDKIGLDPDGAFRAWLEETGIGDHPLMLRVFSRIGEQFREDGLISGDLHTQQGEGEIRARIAQLRDEILKHPEGSAERNRLVDERQNLYRLLPGGDRKVLG